MAQNASVHAVSREVPADPIERRIQKLEGTVGYFQREVEWSDIQVANLKKSPDSRKISFKDAQSYHEAAKRSLAAATSELAKLRES